MVKITYTARSKYKVFCDIKLGPINVKFVVEVDRMRVGSLEYQAGFRTCDCDGLSDLSQ